jgi:DNA-directed RNA polymerase specialized sigma subunit
MNKTIAKEMQRNENRERIMALLKETNKPMTAAEIAARVGLSVWSTMRYLIKQKNLLNLSYSQKYPHYAGRWKIKKIQQPRVEQQPCTLQQHAMIEDQEHQEWIKKVNERRAWKTQLRRVSA